MKSEKCNSKGKLMCVITTTDNIQDLRYFAIIMSNILTNCNIIDVKILSNIKRGFFKDTIIYTAFITSEKSKEIK